MRQHEAEAFFAARLEFQTDVSDVRAALEKNREKNRENNLEKKEFVLIDSRSERAWNQAHIPGAVHLPTADIPLRAESLLDRGVPVVTYCWGPGCNGATRAALALTRAGFEAREMIGGIEYWIREGFPVRTEKGEETADPDPLTAPNHDGACGC
jgi:rhodanese-related sulfurtransferase